MNSTKSTSPSAPKAWKTYEEVAQHLIERFRDHFGLAAVEGKQSVAGQVSGTEWEIDIKGVGAAAGDLILIECRRYPARRLNQEAMGGLAWRILDTGASGGIVVSPLPFQEGAAKVAAASGIVSVQLDPDATTTEYVMAFLERVHVGFEDTVGVTMSEHLTINVYEDGVLVRTEETDG